MADIKAPLFSSDGNAKGEVSLDAEIFGIEPNQAVMHQVVTAQLAGARSGTSKVKRRGEVRGGGRKPWRQKGLGRARAGSTRAPHWTGGGVAHGPQPRDYSQRTPKKMKRLALRSALSARASEQAIKVIDSFEWSEPKTKLAVELLSAVEANKKALVVIGRSEQIAELSFRNLPGIIIVEPGQVTTYDVLWADDLVFSKAGLDAMSAASGTFEVSDKDFVKVSEGSEA